MSKRTEEKHAFIEEFLGRIDERDPDIAYEVWQQRPNTAARVEYSPAGVDCPFVGLGFAKVNWPDEWDEVEGEHLAFRKAAASIWKQMQE